MSTFPLDVALERGACPACSTQRQIWFHYEGSRCRFTAPERESSVPCQNRVGGCWRWTHRNDACCSDRCAAELRERAERVQKVRA